MRFDDFCTKNILAPTLVTFHWTARISDVETGYLQNRPTHGSCWVEWITLNSMKPSVGDWQWYDRGFWSGVSRLRMSRDLCDIYLQLIRRGIWELLLRLLLRLLLLGFELRLYHCKFNPERYSCAFRIKLTDGWLTDQPEPIHIYNGFTFCLLHHSNSLKIPPPFFQNHVFWSRFLKGNQWFWCQKPPKFSPAGS